MIGIAITSKHVQERELVVNALTREKDFCVAGVGDDGFHAIKSARMLQPDIMIMDYKLNDTDAFALAPVIKRYSPYTRLIVLYSPSECEAVQTAIRAGISGCFQRQHNYDDLAASVRSVYYGGYYFGGMVGNYPLNGFSLQAAVHGAAHSAVCGAACGYAKNEISLHQFTNTELHIISDIIFGYTDKEIAKKLNIAQGSLRNCVNKVRSKTGLKNRTQISAYALYAGLVNPLTVKEHIIKALKKSSL